MSWNDDNPLNDLARRGYIDELLDRITLGNAQIVATLNDVVREIHDLRVAMESLNPALHDGNGRSTPQAFPHHNPSVREDSSIDSQPIVKPFQADQAAYQDEVTPEDEELVDKCREIMR